MENCGNKNLSPGKKYEMGICLQLCRFSNLSCPLGSRSSTFVLRIWLDEEGSLKSYPEGYKQNTHSIQTSKEVQGLAGWGKPFSLALGDVMPMSLGPRKCTMTNGAPHLWIHIPSRRSNSRQCFKATKTQWENASQPLTESLQSPWNRFLFTALENPATACIPVAGEWS